MITLILICSHLAAFTLGFIAMVYFRVVMQNKINRRDWNARIRRLKRQKQSDESMRSIGI